MPDPLPIQPGLEIPGTDLTWTFARSGGPGGQHVQTTDTRARLRFALSGCAVLDDAVKDRLRAAHPGWSTTDGDLVLTSDAHRSRQQNVDAIRRRLADAIRAALVVPVERRETRPSRAVRQKRLNAKKARGQIKASRRLRPSDSD